MTGPIRRKYKKWIEGTAKKEDYVEMSQKFRLLCMKTEQDSERDLYEDLRSVKTEGDILQIINRFRKRRVGISEKVGIEEWRDFF